MNWFHRFFNPHCSHCHVEKLESKECRSCETLQQLLNQALHREQQLLDLIIEKNKPVPEIVTEQKIEIAPRAIPWRQQRALLEQEDRQQALLLKQQKAETKIQPVSQMSIEKLEEQLNVSEPAS